MNMNFTYVDSMLARYATNNERISRLLCTVRLSNVSNKMMNASNVGAHASHDSAAKYINFMTPDEMYEVMGIQKRMEILSVALLQYQIEQYDALHHDRNEFGLNILKRYQ